jgi:hypothetical protein
VEGRRLARLTADHIDAQRWQPPPSDWWPGAGGSVYPCFHARDRYPTGKQNTAMKGTVGCVYEAGLICEIIRR